MAYCIRKFKLLYIYNHRDFFYHAFLLICSFLFNIVCIEQENEMKSLSYFANRNYRKERRIESSIHGITVERKKNLLHK